MFKHEYSRTGNTLHSRVSTLKIFTRKRTTPSKPKYFLVSVEGKKKKYISSLYGEPPQFSFEYKGKRYTLTLTENEAIIAEGGVYVPSD